jgi:hypothetical protein
MNEATDRGADRTLSRLGDGLAAHVTVPPVARVLRRATPLHRALFRLEDMAAEVSAPPVPHVIRLATPRRRAVVIGCSICTLGAVGAALILVPRTQNGSIGPSERWAQHAQGPDGTSQPWSPLALPDLPPFGVVPATTSLAGAAGLAAVAPAAVKLAAVAPAAIKPVAVRPAAVRPAAAQPRRTTTSTTPLTRTTPTTPLPTTGGGVCRAGLGWFCAKSTTTVLGVTPSSPADASTVETLTATVSPSAAAGSVQFTDYGKNIGGTVHVSAGTASTTTTLVPGPHSLTAVFTPTDPNAFARSESTQSYTVRPATDSATAVKTALRVPGSPAAADTITPAPPSTTPPTTPPSVQQQQQQALQQQQQALQQQVKQQKQQQAQERALQQQAQERALQQQAQEQQQAQQAADQPATPIEQPPTRRPQHH